MPSMVVMLSCTWCVGHSCVTVPVMWLCCFVANLFSFIYRHFAHFAAVVAEAPGQCLRYCFDEGAEPLWPSRHNIPTPQDIPDCQHCGTPRRFEFQVKLFCCLNYVFKCTSTLITCSSRIHLQHANNECPETVILACHYSACHYSS